MLGVGGSVEIEYPLPGPLPAGLYSADVGGSQAGGDAHLRFDFVLRQAGGADRVIASTEGYASRSDDGGVAPGNVHAETQAPAVAARCDDRLVLRTTFVSGTGSYLEFIARMGIP